MALPYAFDGWRLDPRYLKDLKELAAISSSVAGFPPALQWAGRTLLFPLRNFVMYGAAPFFGLTALAAVPAAIVAARQRKNRALLPLVAYALFVGLYHGLVLVKSLRYFYPAYPAVAALSGLLLARLWVAPIRRRFLRAVPAVVLGGSFLAALAFTAIYRRPHPRLEASRWIFTHVSAARPLRERSVGRRAADPAAGVRRRPLRGAGARALRPRLRPEDRRPRLDARRGRLDRRDLEPRLRQRHANPDRLPDDDGLLPRPLLRRARLRAGGGHRLVSVARAPAVSRRPGRGAVHRLRPPARAALPQGARLLLACARGASSRPPCPRRPRRCGTGRSGLAPAARWPRPWSRAAAPRWRRRPSRPAPTRSSGRSPRRSSGTRRWRSSAPPPSPSVSSSSRACRTAGSASRGSSGPCSRPTS